MEVIRDNSVQYKGSLYLPKDEIVNASPAHSIRSGALSSQNRNNEAAHLKSTRPLFRFSLISLKEDEGQKWPKNAKLSAGSAPALRGASHPKSLVQVNQIRSPRKKGNGQGKVQSRNQTSLQLIGRTNLERGHHCPAQALGEWADLFN
jgi:hypothetical protein